MDWKAIIAAYHDGECDAHTRRQAEQRLAADPAARAYLADLRTLDAALDRVPTATPTADLRDRFWTRFAAETTPTAASAPASTATVGASTSDGRPALLALPRRATSRSHRQQMGQRRGVGGAWGVWLSTAAAAVVVGGASMAVWWAPSTSDTSADFGPDVAVEAPTPTPPATPDTAPPSVAEVGMPGDDMLMVLDLLESGLDFQALASLTETDIAILGDESVWNLLENYDNPN